jgi:hypothetical protein
MDTTDHPAPAEAAEWIDLPCGMPQRGPTDRPEVVLTSPVPRQGRGEPPRVVQIRAPAPARRRRPRPRPPL